MTSRCLMLLALTFALIDSPSLALAQSARDRAELRSIADESAWATGLYVGSGCAIVVGGAATVVAMATMFGNVIGDAPLAFFIGSVALAGLGLLTIPIAIGLDVDATSRWHGVQRRTELLVGPLGLGLRASF